MICLIQRVTESHVKVDGKVIGQISKGMMVLVAFQPNDTVQKLQKMCDRLMKYRLFADENDRMNLNIQQANGEILLVPQFTLAADTQSGLRPSFSSCASPEEASQFFAEFCAMCKQSEINIQQGEFGADMKVQLINDGPVTFRLEV